MNVAELTRNQKLVLDCLRRAERPLSAYQLLDRLRAAGMSAPPTVYRALERLVAWGHVHRIESLNAYVACCDAGHADEVVFVVCRDCGAVAELPAEPSSATLRAQAERSGFTVDKAHFEMVGMCGDCRPAAS